MNRSDKIGDTATRRQTRLATANDWRESKFSEGPRPSSSLLKPFTMNDTAGRGGTRAGFYNKWTESNFRREARTSSLNRSAGATTGIREERREAFSNNWRGDRFAGRQYSAFRNYQSQWHDSGWWHHNCDRIVFVIVYSQPFPFFFDAGYWYPAWGYYPDAYYPYDGPIYGYNDLPPDEIITNVQIQLYNEGYYAGPIDGILGPDTRAAIADYQADHGLAVTAAIDEPTVESLGLV
jgi:putative peptidoglycan binding protein